MKLQDKIYNQQILLLSGNNLTQEELHKRFLLINNGTPLSQQDKRSAQISAGAAYIQGIVDGIPEKGSKLNELSPKLKMFKMQESKFSYVNVSPRGRALEEVVAHWYNMLHQGDGWQINQTQLNKLYNKFFEEGTIKHENYFNKILSQVDKCVCNYTQPSEIKGRPLLLLFYMVKHYMDSGYKINTASFVKNYLNAISELKTKNKIITYTKLNGNDDSLDFGRLLRISQGMDQIGPLTDVILGEISKIQKPIIVDSRRTFSRDEKISKLMEQDSSCGYCGIDLQIENAIGDHMIPHSHGGETSMDNLVVSCNKCNSMKSSLPYDLWETLIPSLKDRNKNN
jgi:hypothetical protein